MSHASNNQAAARMRDPKHDGTAQAIRDALARAGEPLSKYKLHLATGIKQEKIAWTLSQMIGRTGSVVSMKGPKGVVYALYGLNREVKATHTGNIVPSRAAPDFRELHRDPFEKMKLAMLTSGVT